MAAMSKGWLSFALVSLCTWVVLAAPADNPWPQFRQPAKGPARSIGDYSAGCLQGAEVLPLDGAGYQVMRPSRRRYYGHPALVDYIQTLGKRIHESKLGVLLIGDMSQPRGGRAASGHASHQTGLDVDVWYVHPERARVAPLALSAREELAAESVLDATAESLRPRWRKHVQRVLELAVSDERVDRVFVHPAIKRTLCELPTEQRGWLQKVRPWHGHDDHFHARLSCVPSDSMCLPQAPLPAGDGCDKLAWWFDAKAQQERKEARKDYQKTVSEGRGWPAECEALLSSPDELNAVVTN